MPEKLYLNYDFMYEHYVKKRMTLSKIQALLAENHGIIVTPQTLYNAVKKLDLLKFRGKGRNLKTHTGMKKQAPSPMKIAADKRRREQKTMQRRMQGR